MPLQLNIVIEPAAEIRAAAIALSQHLAGIQAAHFALDGTTYHPHATVYKATIPDDHRDTVTRLVTALAERQRFACPFQPPKAGRGYVFIPLLCIGLLRGLHEQTVRQINRYRCRDARIRESNGRQWSDTERRNNRQWGHPNVFNCYRPHLTVIRFREDAQADAALSHVAWESPTFGATALAIYRMGDHGTCRELLHRAEFQ